ncbi:MAG TPA: glucose 1-dehydrogenase [Mycobacteriales bacterium]|nr:glucose 1-dehydrogenase [Mycobacteriales bacterium]
MTTLDRFRLDGKVALVTGASSGLGVAIAQCLAEAGADVVLGARRLDRLEDTKKLVEATGRRAITVQTDVTDPDQCTAMVAAGVEAFGKVSVLVNNAGFGWAAPATRETPEEFRKVIDINLNGQYWMAQAFGRAATPMPGGGGSIINISSVLGLKASAVPQAGYSASKAGLIGLTRDLAMQWTGRKGIRVNAIAPGYFPSEMTDEMAEGTADMIKLVTPIGRLGEPHEIGDACVYLASDASSYVTGITLPVDGGMVMP